MKPMPTFKGKTLYGLLKWVIKVEQDEPKRLMMDAVVLRWEGKEKGFYFGPIPQPVCGSVLCHAGWICQGAGKHISDTEMYIAKEIICGLPLKRGTDEWAMVAELHECFITFPSSKPGTLRYVREAQAPLLKFMEKWETQLKHTHLKGVER